MTDYPLPDRLKRHAVRAAAALLCSLCLCETAFCGTIPLEDQRCRTTYEIFVYSFCDSDADGTGDLNGVRKKASSTHQLPFPSFMRELGFSFSFISFILIS